MSETPQARYWIVVSSPDNFARTAATGFTVQGLKSRHRKKAERMQPGDRLVWYVTGRKAFAGTATIESPSFESHERIWVSNDPKKADEDYPFRVRISENVILTDLCFVPAEAIARQMTYVAKWPAANWTLAFQGNVHEIDASDFEKIQAALTDRVLTCANAPANL